jgi:hypothetical protein
MDASTAALTGLPELTVGQNITKIRSIHALFREHEADITLEVVRNIFNEIDRVYYNNTFSARFLLSGPVPKRPLIKYKDLGKDCDHTAAFLEATAYDKSDKVDIKTYDYGFNIALTCINSLEEGEIYYSGGYITKSKIIYIILMLLHESIHIIEYKDSLLTTSKSSHSVYFFKYGYKRFKIVSRLSEKINDIALLTDDLEERLTLIGELDDQPDIDDGIDLLNDHSSYKDDDGDVIPLGYIVHTIFTTSKGFRYLENIRAGGKSRKNVRNSARKTRRS